jgi:hypothetical protein
MTDDTPTADDIRAGSNVRDNYDPEAVRAAYRGADREDMERLRIHFRRSVDDGRFWEMLDAVHKVLGRSDLQRREHFEENYSDHLLQWVATYGLVEDLNTFPRLTGVEAHVSA